MPFAWAAGASAVAGIAGSYLQSQAVGDAQDSANAASKQARDQARADLAPWTQTGGNALGVAGNLSGANGADAATAAMKDFQTSPGYQWQLGEGIKAVDAGAAAKGILRSGANLKAETAYGQGLASQEFGNYYNRLYGLANLGQASAAGQAAASTSAGKDIASTDASAGSALSSIYGNTASGLTTDINQYAKNSLYGGGSGSSSFGQNDGTAPAGMYGNAQQGYLTR